MSAKKYPSWLPPVGFVAALALFLLFSNQPAKLQDGGDAILTDSQYEAARIEMEKLSLPHIKAFDAGEKLSADAVTDLRKAGSIIDRMTRYAPVASGLFYLSGKIYHCLGEDSLAEDRFQQCTFVVPNDITGHPENGKVIEKEGAECSYQLSELLLRRRQEKAAFDAADAANKVVPHNPLYLTARASALNELGRIPEAKKDLQEALKLDPSYARAKGLLRFIEHAVSGPDTASAAPSVQISSGPAPRTP